MAFCSFGFLLEVERDFAVRPDLDWDVLACNGMNESPFDFSASVAPRGNIGVIPRRIKPQNSPARLAASGAIRSCAALLFFAPAISAVPSLAVLLPEPQIWDFLG